MKQQKGRRRVVFLWERNLRNPGAREIALRKARMFRR